jgi:putative methylase
LAADIMQLNELERLLATIPPHPAPRADLEQYATPAELVAPLLYEAFALGDIEDKSVADLGCGTGVFAIGAALLGARSVVALDVDATAVAVARREAARLGASIDLIVGDVGAWDGRADTVLMNPPFGSQQRGADRPFLEAAFRGAPVVYSLHNAVTRPFVEANAAASGFAITHRWRLLFPLRHQYRHQTKAVQEIEVIAFRMEHPKVAADEGKHNSVSDVGTQFG